MNVKDSIKSQYHASLEMLRQAIVACPDALWDDRGYKNVFWHVSYHALWYTHFYLQPSEKDPGPLAKHSWEFLDLGRPPSSPDKERENWESYSKEQVLECLELCRKQVGEQVAVLELDAPSGFGWLPCNKLELQFYNIRHLQQHIGELCERLGARGDIEVGWVGMKPG